MDSTLHAYMNEDIVAFLWADGIDIAVPYFSN